MKQKLFIIFIFLFQLSSCQNMEQELKINPEQKIDLSRYEGLWYDYAHFPARFLDGCTNISAEYKKENPGYISVYNRCIKENGKSSSIKGKAFIVKSSGNSKLKVQFFWPFRADYWILDIDKNYEWALVGGPSRKYLWILSRETNLDEKIYKQLVLKAEELGFDTAKLIKTIHQ